MKRLFLLIILLLFLPFSKSFAQAGAGTAEMQKAAINILLDQWHRAAGEADFNSYFSKLTEDAIFIGTDPTENWRKPEFQEWSRPYFKRGKAWDFMAIERNFFTTDSCEIAWFDELLDTQMGICRGSGFLVKENGNWEIRHYALSIAVPMKM